MFFPLSLFGQTLQWSEFPIILETEPLVEQWLDLGDGINIVPVDQVQIELPEGNLNPYEYPETYDHPIDSGTDPNVGTGEITNERLQELIEVLGQGDMADDTFELNQIITILETPVEFNEFEGNETLQSSEANGTAQTAFFPYYESYLNEKKDNLKQMFHYDQFLELSETLPQAKTESLNFHIVDVGDRTFEIDLSTDRLDGLFQIGRIGLTLLIVWGLLWVFFKLNSVLLAT